MYKKDEKHPTFTGKVLCSAGIGSHDKKEQMQKTINTKERIQKKLTDAETVQR